MDVRVTEAAYPLTFRQEESKKLGEYLKQRQCVNLIGMKRVGISNFLRFFLIHTDISKTYVSTKQQHLFISVDLNDLVERELFPFWTLTLKRIVDAADGAKLPAETKKQISALFLRTIQSRDLFLAIDNIRLALSLLVKNDILPTLFFLRFDRLKDAFNPSFFDNLEGLRDASDEQVSYVFTSYRSLDVVFPAVKTSLSVFAQHMYVRPAKSEDMRCVYEAYTKRYGLSLSESVEEAIFSVVNGNLQYLQLALIILKEKGDISLATESEVLQLLLSDERIVLESEELWESLSPDEQAVLLRVAKKQTVTEADHVKAVYLWETGFVQEHDGVGKVFSPLLAHYLLSHDEQTNRKSHAAHLTRKEHLLFKLLESHLGEICERDKIIEAVWPEYSEFGVSDWAIDRLVARVRVKLREQESPYEVVTVRTRGYKLAMAKG